MNRLPFKPSQSTYSVAEPTNIVEYETYGFTRQRIIAVSSTFEVSVTIQIADDNDATVFWAFWRQHTKVPRKFLWSIMTDGSNLEDHICQLIPQSLATSNYNGQIYEISFRVRAKAVAARNNAFDDELLVLVNNGIGEYFINRLAYILNVQAPIDLRSGL